MLDLKGFLKREHGITSAVQLKAHIESAVGVTLSVQTLRALLRNPVAPRMEMIQLLCDAFNCRSDAFYLLTPNPDRARRWAEARVKGEKPSALYQPKPADSMEESVAPLVQTVSTKPKCLRATFTDPRIFYNRRISQRRSELGTTT